MDIQYYKLTDTDKHLLKTIYQLRVLCRNDDGLITFEKYPEGWYDELDKVSHHFVALSNDEIIGAARATLLTTIKDHPYYSGIKHILSPKLIDKEIAYFSRDVIHPSFRGIGIQRKLFSQRYKLCSSYNIHDIFIDIPKSGYQLHYYLKKGFSVLGEINTSMIKWDLDKTLLMHRDLLEE